MRGILMTVIAVASSAQGEAAEQELTTQPQIFAGAIANFFSAVGHPHSLVYTRINHFVTVLTPVLGAFYLAGI